MTVAALVTFSVAASLPWYAVSRHVEDAVVYDAVYTAASSGLPAGWLACCGTHLLRAVLRSASVVRPSTTGAGQLLFHDELQTATTVVVLVVVFVVCRCVHCVLVGLAAGLSDGRLLLCGVAAMAVTINGVVNPAVYAARNPHVARVLGVGRRQQRYGGYVADEQQAATTANRLDVAGTAGQDGGESGSHGGKVGSHGEDAG